LGGRPGRETLRTSSSVLLGYKASLVRGFIPARTIRCLAAKYDMLRALATSCIVMPVITYLSALYQTKLNCQAHDTFFCKKVEKNIKERHFDIIIRYISYIYRVVENAKNLLKWRYGLLTNC
jgi:hypothetical protein